MQKGKTEYLQAARQLQTGLGIHMLDLGCCTELDYDAFFAENPDLQITGIAEEKRLNMLLLKNSGKRIEHLRLVFEDFWKVDMRKEQYDFVLSDVLTSPYSRKERGSLYKRIYNALKEHGIYVQCDFKGRPFDTMVDASIEVAEQIALFLEAGFDMVEKIPISKEKILLKAVKKIEKAVT